MRRMEICTLSREAEREIYNITRTARHQTSGHALFIFVHLGRIKMSAKEVGFGVCVCVAVAYSLGFENLSGNLNFRHEV